MDPHRPNLEAAGRALREFAAARRHHALALAQLSATAAAAGGSGVRPATAPSSSVTQQPEFLLPYLLYLLGHHPDMPQVRQNLLFPPLISPL